MIDLHGCSQSDVCTQSLICSLVFKDERIKILQLRIQDYCAQRKVILITIMFVPYLQRVSEQTVTGGLHFSFSSTVTPFPTQIPSNKSQNVLKGNCYLSCCLYTCLGNRTHSLHPSFSRCMLHSRTTDSNFVKSFVQAVFFCHHRAILWNLYVRRIIV